MRRLLVKCTWGAERPEACVQAFTVAATAVSAGAEVSLWLSGDAVLLVTSGADELAIPHSPPLSDLRDAVLAGGSITVCTQCVARRGITESQLVPGVRIGGSASFVEQALDASTTALVY